MDGSNRLTIGRRLVEVRRAPGDRPRAPFDVADGDRQRRPSEAQMPAAEQATPHQPGISGCASIDECARSDDSGRNAERRRLALDQCFLQRLAPCVRAEAMRDRGAAASDSSWRSQGDRGGLTTDRLLTRTRRETPARLHRVEQVPRRIDGVALMGVDAARGFRRGVDDDAGAGQRRRRQRAAEIRDDPWRPLRRSSGWRADRLMPRTRLAAISRFSSREIRSRRSRPRAAQSSGAAGAAVRAAVRAPPARPRPRTSREAR